MNDIKLVPLSEKHLEMVRNWRNSPEVNRYMYTEHFISEQEQKEWFAQINACPTSKYWIIEYENKPLGVVSISEISLTYDSCFWAFYLGDSSVRGAGIGAKVEFTMLNYVFETLKLNKLRCEVLISNQQVISMHEKFGFRREALYREHVKKEGQYYDVVGLAMLKKEWEQLKGYHYKRIYEKKDGR